MIPCLNLTLVTLLLISKFKYITWQWHWWGTYLLDTIWTVVCAFSEDILQTVVLGYIDMCMENLKAALIVKKQMKMSTFNVFNLQK